MAAEKLKYTSTFYVYVKLINVFKYSNLLNLIELNGISHWWTTHLKKKKNNIQKIIFKL